MTDCCQHVYVIQDLEKQVAELKRQLAEVKPVTQETPNEEVKTKRPYTRRNPRSDSE